MKKRINWGINSLLLLLACLFIFNAGSIQGKAYGVKFAERNNVRPYQLGTKESADIEENDGYIWYSFTTGTDANAWYNFEFKSTGLEYSRCAIFDSDGANFHTVSVSQNKSNTSTLRLSPSSEYFMQVYSDDYQTQGSFTITVTANSDEGDTLETATTIGNEYTGTLATGQDVDYLAFNSGTNTACTVTLKNIDGSYSVFGQIFKADGTKVADYFSSSKASANSQTVLLNPNTTYYLKVSNDCDNRDNTYKVSIDGRTDEGSIKKSANKIKLSKTNKGIIDTDDDVDWYKIKITKKGNYKFILKNIDCDNSATIELYKGSRSLGSSYAYKAQGCKLKQTLKKGTYYIKVSGYKGNYSVRVKR